MQIPVKKLNNTFSLPVYGLGTWMMGGGMEADYSEDEKCVSVIKDAISKGITHIDTAEMYGAGHAEELIAIAKKGTKRSDLILASKVSTGFEGGFDGVLRACEASLSRLETDYLDVYMLHQFPMHDIKSVMRAMNRLKNDGLVRNIGVSNCTVARLKYAQELCDSQIVCNQLEYSLQVREAEVRGIVQYCQENDIFVTAWGPLNKGKITEPNILHEMAELYQKTPRQIAINWLISQNNVITIPKTTSIEHLEENLGAFGWEMSSVDIERLRVGFPDQKQHSERYSLDYPANIPA